MRKLFLVLCLATAPAWATWQNGYAGRLLFTFNVHPNSTLTNFPNLISGTYSQFADTGHGGYVSHTVALNGQTVPADLIFTTDATGVTIALSWEIESWNNTTGAIVAWVQATRQAGSGSSYDTLIYAFAGNGNVTTYQCTAGSTWSGYGAVWHLPNGTTLSGVDSSGNGNTAVFEAGPAPISTGQIDGAMNLNSSDTQYVRVASSSTVKPSSITLSAWVYVSTAISDSEIFSLDYKANGTWNSPWESYNLSTGNGGHTPFGSIAISGAFDSVTGSSFSTGAWHYLVMTFNGTTLYVYTDGGTEAGGSQNSASYSGSIDYGTSADLAIGQRSPYNSGQWFLGNLDELRISSSARSADWIAHEYVQQSQISAWYTVGAWTQPTPDYNCTGPSSGYEYAASTSFTCTKASGTWSTGNTVTIADGSQGGQITPNVGSAGTTPLTVTPGNGASSFTYTYTPATVATINLSYSNNYSSYDSNSDSYTASAPALSFSSGPSSGNLFAVSSAFTVTLAGPAFNGAYSVTISDNGNGGTITSGGSSAANTLTVTPASGSSFTFTYTPVTIGARQLLLSTTYGWTNPSVQAYAVTSTDVCTFTAKASGNWTSAATWTASGCTGAGHATPVSGDAVTIAGYRVAIPAGTLAYGGSCPSNNTTYDLTISPSGGTSGVLEVVGGGTFWFCGNVKLNASANATPTSFGIFQIDTGGAMKWDLNNGSTPYHLVPGVTGGWNNLIVGTPGDTCTFASESCPTNILPVNVGSANPILVDGNGTTDSMTYQVYGALIKNCGSASIGCLNYQTDGTTGRNAYANAGLVDIEGSMFDTTGNFQAADTYATQIWTPVASFTFKENRFLNDLAGIFNLYTGKGMAATTKPCIFADNYFSATFGQANDIFGACTFTGNVFVSGVAWNVASGTQPFAVFDQNVFLVQVGDENLQSVAPEWGNYFSWSAHGGSTHNMDFGAANEWHIGNVYESLDTNQQEGHCTISGAAGYTDTILDNLSLISPNGNNSCQIGMGATGTNNTPSPTVYADHNGAFGNGFYSWILMLGHDGPIFPSNQAIRSLRSNIGYSATTGTQNFAVGPNGLTGVTAQLAAAPNNNVYVTQENSNVWYNAASASADYGTATANPNCDPSTSNGTPYDQCTASGTPGAADITANPNLLDHTRGLLAWASRKHGQAATSAGAQAALIGCPSLDWCASELVAWVQRGYQPMNMALKGKAYDGRIVRFTGSPGSGYSGTCGMTITPQDADDLGYGAAATCTFVSGVPSIQITNPGMHYRIATPATVAVTCGGCTPVFPASLTPVIAPLDPGPVQMVAFGSVQ